jgi:excisionase family DNA binding protein
MDTQFLCSIRDAANALGIGRTKLYDMLAKGQLKSMQIGSRRLVQMDSIKALIERANGGAA